MLFILSLLMGFGSANLNMCREFLEGFDNAIMVFILGGQVLPLVVVGDVRAA